MHPADLFPMAEGDDNLRCMKRSHPNLALAAERPEMSDEERQALVERLWQRLHDPDGLDWETLKNIEQPEHSQ